MNEMVLDTALQQESARNDVERFFGTLQGRFKILRTDFHKWSDEAIIKIKSSFLFSDDMLAALWKDSELDGKVEEKREPIDTAYLSAFLCRILPHLGQVSL